MLNLPKLSKHMNSLAHEKTVKYFVCKEATEGNELFCKNMAENSDHFHASPVHQEYYFEVEIENDEFNEFDSVSYLCFYVSYPMGEKLFKKYNDSLFNNSKSGVFIAITSLLKLKSGTEAALDYGDWLFIKNEDSLKNSMFSVREGSIPMGNDSEAQKKMTDFSGILYETLKVVFHDGRKTVRLSNVQTPKKKIKTNDGNKFIKTPYTIITKEKLVKKTEERIGKKLDWTHSWPVRGHWRNIKTFGKSYKGEVVKGKTWVHEHARGNKDVETTIKPRVIL